MVVGVLEADLDSIVVDVAYGEVGLDARHIHRLELEVGHCAGRVLRERLVDADAKLWVPRGIALDEMCRKYFLNNILRFFHAAYYTILSHGMAARTAMVTVAVLCWFAFQCAVTIGAQRRRGAEYAEVFRLDFSRAERVDRVEAW